VTPLGVLLLDGTHERAHYALVLATGAAALGRTVVLFVTNDGIQLLLRDAPLLADPREMLLASRGVAGIGALLEAAADLGLRCIVCEAGLRAGGLQPEQLGANIEIAGIATFLGAVGTGQIVAF